MAKVPLIPSTRPRPKVLMTRGKAPRQKKAEATKKGTQMAKTKAKTVPFEVHNTENIEDKPKNIQRLWAILSKMDPEGELFVNDKGIVMLEGDGPDDRTPKALGFTAKESDLLRPWGIADSPEEDNIELATGVLFSMYQLVELAYELGRQDESGEVTRSLVDAAVGDDDEDDDYEGEEDDNDDDDEDFDDDDLEVIDEDEEIGRAHV